LEAEGQGLLEAGRSGWPAARPGWITRARRAQTRPMISHIVLFEPKEGLSESDVRYFAQQLKDAMQSAPSVRRASVGRRVEVQSGNRNFGDATYSFSAVVEFDDSKGLIEYLQHPKHVELGRLFWLHCARTVVLEVESVDATTDEVIDLLVRRQN